MTEAFKLDPAIKGQFDRVPLKRAATALVPQS
jgi:hypothetical protein